MSLNHEEIEQLISSISSGKKFLYLDDINDFIVILFPDNDTKQMSEIIYETAYNKAIAEGLLPTADLEELLYKRGIFTEEDISKTNKLRDKLEAQRILLSKTLKVRANQDRIKNVIKSLENELLDLIYKKQSKLIMSADNRADDVKQHYLCASCAFDSKGTRLWPTYDHYLKDSNQDLKDRVFSSFVTLLNGINTSIIRELARSTLWRIRFTTSLKLSEKLFGVPTTSYTTDQVNLVYWSNYYENIFSMLPEHRPSNDIINDDELLDRYMDDYYKELSNDYAINRSNKARNKGAMSAFDAEEVIITQSNELYQEINYDKPREAQAIKDRIDIKKRTISNK